eukprot:2599206-Rhodomonas_salina.1
MASSCALSRARLRSTSSRARRARARTSSTSRSSSWCSRCSPCSAASATPSASTVEMLSPLSSPTSNAARQSWAIGPMCTVPSPSYCHRLTGTPATSLRSTATWSTGSTWCLLALSDSTDHALAPGSSTTPSSRPEAVCPVTSFTPPVARTLNEFARFDPNGAPLCRFSALSVKTKEPACSGGVAAAPRATDPARTTNERACSARATRKIKSETLFLVAQG